MSIMIWVLVALCHMTVSYPLDDITDIYISRFANCTGEEYSMMKCVEKTGVCLARTDTIERIPFCLCLPSFTGHRCETSVIQLSSSECVCTNLVISLSVWIVLAVCAIIVFAVLYIKRRSIYTPVRSTTSDTV